MSEWHAPPDLLDSGRRPGITKVSALAVQAQKKKKRKEKKRTANAPPTKAIDATAFVRAVKCVAEAFSPKGCSMVRGAGTVGRGRGDCVAARDYSRECNLAIAY